MRQLKSSSVLKADAREILLGKYKTVVLAYVIMELFASGILTFVELQVNLQTTVGLVFYYAVYLIVMLLSAIFIVGQNHLYLNIFRNQEFETNNIWIGFRTCADRAILIYLIIGLKTFACAVPCMIACAVMVITGNFYLSLLVAAGAIFAIVGSTLVQLNYSQALYLLLDYPNETTAEILTRSKAMMRGHRAGYFYLHVSFLGVFLLGAITFGLGMLWIYPYLTATKTAYYLDLCEKQS